MSLKLDHQKKRGMKPPYDFGVYDTTSPSVTPIKITKIIPENSKKIVHDPPKPKRIPRRKRAVIVKPPVEETVISEE